MHTDMYMYILTCLLTCIGITAFFVVVEVNTIVGAYVYASGSPLNVSFGRLVVCWTLL